MSGTTLIGAATLGYLIAAGLMWQALNAKQQNAEGLARWALISAAMALIIHLAYLYLGSSQGGTLNFSLSSMTIIVSAIIMLIFLLGCLGMEIARLGIVMFPLTALSLLFSIFWNSDLGAAGNRTMLPLSAFSTHVLLSILAYSLLTIATVQSLLYLYQERQFKNRAKPSVLASLPPLETMEQLLFRLLWIGFALLTFTLLSGALFSQQIFDQPFEFNHHTVLAILGWFVFAVLLFKRTRQGLRGTQATIWTVSGFILIQLGYFGTKFINESLKL